MGFLLVIYITVNIVYGYPSYNSLNVGLVKRYHYASNQYLFNIHHFNPTVRYGSHGNEEYSVQQPYTDENTTVTTLNSINIISNDTITIYDTNSTTSSNTMKDLSSKLSHTGQSGLIAYGVLNCLYYTTMTAIVWVYQSKNIVTSSSASTVVAASSSSTLLTTISKTASQLGKIMIIVWAGSQITKALRIFLSIAIAPFIDKVIEYIVSIELFAIKTRKHAIYFILSSLWVVTLSFYSTLIFGTSMIQWLK